MRATRRRALTFVFRVRMTKYFFGQSSAAIYVLVLTLKQGRWAGFAASR